MQCKIRSNYVILCLVGMFFLFFVQDTFSNEKTFSQDAGKLNLSEANKGDQDIPCAKEHQIIVYYFHGTNRCQTCKRIEQLTKQAVTESFANEMKGGFVEMKVINVDETKNHHFNKKYKLFTRSVIVSDMVAGKERQWKNLQKVWELVRNDAAFKEYIRNEIKAYF